MSILSRYLTPPRKSFFLFGPRGTGKSLWVKEQFKKALFLDFLSPETFRTYSAYPERLREIIAANPGKTDIVLDEIQKVPQVLTVIHSLIEEHKDLRFIMTGSSSRKIKKTGADLLGGRASSVSMHPFMAAELAGAFSLNTALETGLLPLVRFAEDPRQTLAGYLALYIKEEVQAEALVRNIPAFARFLEAVSFSHGSILNISGVARECAAERKTVEGYLKILEDLLLSFQVGVFTKRAKRRLVEHSKFYFFDAGVFRSIRPRGPLDRPQEIDGGALEGLVAQQLRAWIDYRGKENRLYYWRTPKGLEVDFVVYGEDGIFAFEVKNSAKVYPESLRALEAFKQDYPEAECVCLYRGAERLKKGNILCLPCGEFLAGIKPGKLLG
ncbi:MAG TPA: ATPase [Elusimicrobia bacterium]|nr:ATPase [Elusimicrobiota bacterium]